MILLCTSNRYGVFLEYHFKLQFSAPWSIHAKLCHEKMLNLRCIFPPKNKTPTEKNLTSHPWKISNTLTRNSTQWE